MLHVSFLRMLHVPPSSLPWLISLTRLGEITNCEDLRYVILSSIPRFSLYIGPDKLEIFQRMLVPGDQTPSETGQALYV